MGLKLRDQAKMSLEQMDKKTIVPQSLDAEALKDKINILEKEKHELECKVEILETENEEMKYRLEKIEEISRKIKKIV